MVVIDKSHGGYKEVKSFGVVKTDEEADLLMAEPRNGYVQPTGSVCWTLLAVPLGRLSGWRLSVC